MYYMTDAIVSVRVDKNVHNQMKLHDEINWSGVIRKSIKEQFDKTDEIDVERARRAAKAMDEIRRAKVFDLGKSSVEIIREWREKRR